MGPWFVLASVPFWVFANDHTWSMAMALGLSIGGMAIAVIGPVLPGRSIRRGGEPLAHLASGPIAPVVPKIYTAGQRSRFVSVAAKVLAVLAVVLPVFSIGGDHESQAVWIGLAISSAIMAATFVFSNWFATRVRLRVDEHGLHSRTMFFEHTIRWSELAGLTLRYMFLPGFGMRLVYYCAYSPTREFAFPSSMAGATDLQMAIEQATGLTWPAPEIEANF